MDFFALKLFLVTKIVMKLIRVFVKDIFFAVVIRDNIETAFAR